MNTITKDGIRNLRLESLCHAAETAFGAIRAKITNGIQPTEEDLHAIVLFVAVQLVRTPKFRGYWQLTGQEERNLRLSEIANPALRSAVEQTMQTIEANHKQVLSLASVPKAIELLGSMRIQLFKAPTARAFITSDAPCCVIDYKTEARSPFESLAGQTGNVLMPLSPDVIILFDRSEEPHSMTQLFPESSLLARANSMIWAGSVSWVVLPGVSVRDEWLVPDRSSSGEEYSVM